MAMASEAEKKHPLDGRGFLEGMAFPGSSKKARGQGIGTGTTNLLVMT